MYLVTIFMLNFYNIFKSKNTGDNMFDKMIEGLEFLAKIEGMKGWVFTQQYYMNMANYLKFMSQFFNKK